ncbi:MAG: hypothetical protein J6N76_06460 [Lachnospiraceae bacterium]|nr:hypothetical protein [Lachnospiraceae bacterium]
MNLNSGIVANNDISFSAVLLSLGVFILAMRINNIKDPRINLLRVMSGLAVVTSITYVFMILLEGPENVEYNFILTLVSTVDEVTCNMYCMYWLYYVLFSMYKSNDYLKKMQRIFNFPFIVLLVLDIINIFTGFLWYFDENNAYQSTFLYFIQDVVRYSFIIVALIQYAIFKKNEGKTHFFNIWLSSLPLIISGILESILDSYYIFPMGLAIGTCMLCMGITTEIGFIDEETGFYTGFYLAQIRELINKKQFKLASIITYKLKKPEDMVEFSKALIELLPEDCETVRFDDHTLITLSETTDQGLVYMLSEDVMAICEDMDTEVEVENVVKSKKEDPVSFLTKNINLDAVM